MWARLPEGLLGRWAMVVVPREPPLIRQSDLGDGNPTSVSEE